MTWSLLRLMRPATLVLLVLLVAGCGRALPTAADFLPDVGSDVGSDVGLVDAGTGNTGCVTNADCFSTACPPGSKSCICIQTPSGRQCVPTCKTTADCPVPRRNRTLICGKSGTCEPQPAVTDAGANDAGAVAAGDSGVAETNSTDGDGSPDIAGSDVAATDVVASDAVAADGALGDAASGDVASSDAAASDAASLDVASGGDVAAGDGTADSGPVDGGPVDSGPVDAGGGKPKQTPCVVDKDCPGKCVVAAKTCVCGKAPEGFSLCMPGCDSDADCPKGPKGGKMNCLPAQKVCVPPKPGGG